jgi:hypothetical protein
VTKLPFHKNQRIVRGFQHFPRARGADSSRSYPSTR